MARCRYVVAHLYRTADSALHSHNSSSSAASKWSTVAALTPRRDDPSSDGASASVTLPQHFSELYNQTTRRVCTVCGTRPLQPACCLLCGELVCAASDCCREGGDDECCRHAQQKHLGIAAFLVVRRTEVLLVRGRKHCWWGSLYLDGHGEEDRGLRRGRPLKLALNRLHELTTLWLSNGVREFLVNHQPPFPHLLLLHHRQPRVS